MGLDGRSQHLRPWKWAVALPHSIGSEREHCQTDHLQTGITLENIPVTKTEAHASLKIARSQQYLEKTKSINNSQTNIPA